MNEVMASISSALTLWLWQATLAFSLVSLILLLGHRHLLAWLGPRALYLVWVLLPVAALIPAVSQIAAPFLGSWQAPAQLSGLRSWTVMPEAITPALGGSSIYNVLALSFSLLWLVPALTMIIALAIQYRQLGQCHTSVYKGLRIQRSSAGSSPGVSGLINPRLHLPCDFEQRFNRREQRLIVQHELTHWRRHDLHANLLAWCLLACQWFNPLAWLAYRRFRADQELACDADVLAAQSKVFPRNKLSIQVCYANALLAAMQSVSIDAHPRRLWSNAACTHYGIALGDKAMAQERFNQLKQQQQPRRWPALASVSLVTLLGLATLGPVAANGGDDQAALSQATEAQTPIVRINPKYPEEAAEQGIEGHVDLSFVINDEGRVDRIEVLDAEPRDIFSAAAVEALQRWRYAPQNDLPQQIRLQFALNND